MATTTKIKDYTALIPFVLFAIFAGIVIYGIIKGSSKKLTQAEKDEIYSKQQATL